MRPARENECGFLLFFAASAICGELGAVADRVYLARHSAKTIRAQFHVTTAASQ